MRFTTALKFAQDLVSKHVGPGDTVIDATVGNGKDTLFLSRTVGLDGTVYGFDIQEEALNNAKEYVAQQLGDNDNNDTTISESHDITSHIVLFQESHAYMSRIIPLSEHGHIAAVMFNLGYLPGGDHSLITQPDSTLPALNAALQLLKKNGLLTIMIYAGHPGGQEEADQVQAWANSLPQRHYQVLLYQFINQVNSPPFLIAVRIK